MCVRWLQKNDQRKKENSLFVLDLLSLEAVLEVVEEGGGVVNPLAEDDHGGVVVSLVGGHVGVVELPRVERADDGLDEGLGVGLEGLDLFVGLAEGLELLDEVLEVALDVAHVGGLVEGGLGEAVVVDDIDDLLLLVLGGLAGGTFLGVLVDVGGDTEVFAADLDVAALDDVHAVLLVEDEAGVAENLSLGEEILEDEHYVIFFLAFFFK